MILYDNLSINDMNTAYLNVLYFFLYFLYIIYLLIIFLFKLGKIGGSHVVFMN